MQPRFRIDLEIVATDVNVETGPKTGRNLEPVRLLVVSEADLLGEINKDEEGLIGKLDDAIKTVSQQRAELGAYQNRFEHTINNLNVSVENLSASESRIRDTDMAQEMVSYTRAQILTQAGTSMLSQANQASQNVLALLR